MIPLELPLYDFDGWTGNATDDYGVDWIITGEEGWSGAVDAQAAIEDRPDGDGADDAPTYEATRVITLTGTPSPRTGPTQNAAKDRLNAVAYTGRGLYPLTVTENHLTRMAMVRRSGAQKIADRPGNAFDFSISLVAPDPGSGRPTRRPRPSTCRTRSTPRAAPTPAPTRWSTPAAARSARRSPRRTIGNRASYVVAAFSGGVDQPGVVNVDTGAVVQFDVSLSPGDFFEVDLGARTAVINGTASRRGALLTGSSWFDLPPGDTPLRMVGNPNGLGGPLDVRPLPIRMEVSHG
jgi:hypothetical protein